MLYRISQLISSKVDPGDILQEYKTTRFPGNFYNMKIGTAYSDLELKLDVMSVLSLCTDREMQDKSDRGCSMGVDTGSQLHVVLLEDVGGSRKQHLAYVGICNDFEELDALIRRFKVDRCVIDGLPEQHATRKFALRHRGKVYLSYFNDNQRGAPKWSHIERKVESNRTESLDSSRAAIREKLVSLPRRSPLMEIFAKHMSANAKKLEEDPDTGAKKYRYIRAGGPDHFSLAFTYAWLASQDYSNSRGIFLYYRREAERLGRPWQ